MPVSPVIRDGCSWLVGTAADVAWVNAATSIDLAITSAIPPVFAGYGTAVLPEIRTDRQRHDRAVVELRLRVISEVRLRDAGFDMGQLSVPVG